MTDGVQIIYCLDFLFVVYIYVICCSPLHSFTSFTHVTHLHSPLFVVVVVIHIHYLFYRCVTFYLHSHCCCYFTLILRSHFVVVVTFTLSFYDRYLVCTHLTDRLLRSLVTIHTFVTWTLHLPRWFTSARISLTLHCISRRRFVCSLPSLITLPRHFDFVVFSFIRSVFVGLHFYIPSLFSHYHSPLLSPFWPPLLRCHICTFAFYVTHFVIHDSCYHLFTFHVTFITFIRFHLLIVLSFIVVICLAVIWYFHIYCYLFIHLHHLLFGGTLCWWWWWVMECQSGWTLFTLLLFVVFPTPRPHSLI